MAHCAVESSWLKLRRSTRVLKLAVVGWLCAWTDAPMGYGGEPRPRGELPAGRVKRVGPLQWNPAGIHMGGAWSLGRRWVSPGSPCAPESCVPSSQVVHALSRLRGTPPPAGPALPFLSCLQSPATSQWLGLPMEEAPAQFLPFPLAVPIQGRAVCPLVPPAVGRFPSRVLAAPLGVGHPCYDRASQPRHSLPHALRPRL